MAFCYDLLLYCYWASTVVLPGDLDGDLILYLHADYIVNPLKWLLVHKNFIR